MTLIESGAILFFLTWIAVGLLSIFHGLGAAVIWTGVFLFVLFAIFGLVSIFEDRAALRSNPLLFLGRMISMPFGGILMVLGIMGLPVLFVLVSVCHFVASRFGDGPARRRRANEIWNRPS